LIAGTALPPHRRHHRAPASGPLFVNAVNIGVLDGGYFLFPRKPLRGAVSRTTSASFLCSSARSENL